MDMNLPIANFKRDELYTFIVGIFAASSWYLYFRGISLIAADTIVIDPIFLLTWLTSTGLVYVVYASLLLVADPLCKMKIRAQNDDAELCRLNLTRNLSFFWSGPLEENKMHLHLFGLMTVAAIFVYHPFLSFIAPKLSWSAFVLVHVMYTVLTVGIYLLFFKVFHYLQQVYDFLAKNYCDTLDQQTYLRERASFYARIKNEEFLRNYQEFLRQHQGGDRA